MIVGMEEPQSGRNDAPVSAGVPSRFERQKQRILDAATVLLNQKGVWGMTLQEVAGALDLRTSSVTYYYSRRDQLAAAIFEDSLARLARVASLAAGEATPQTRLSRYVELYLDQLGCGLRGEARPFAILSEIRAMDDPVRSSLIAQYQGVFRTVRGFFGAADSESRKRLLDARTHILNEALFWSEIWLPRFAFGDFEAVRKRFIDILGNGIGVAERPWHCSPAADRETPPADGREAFLRVATRLINDFGYKGASVQRISSDLNRAKTSFYRHSGGKDELVAACSRNSYHRLRSLRKANNHCDVSATDRLACVIGDALSLQFAAEYPLLRSSAFQAMPDPLRASAIARSERTALGLMDMVVEAMREGGVRIVDPLIASHVILSSIDASYDLKSWRNLPLATAVETYLHVLEKGLLDPD